MEANSAPTAKPQLKRVLSVWDLIYYGLILTSPIAAVPHFGEMQTLSHGHAVSTLLLAMVAMSVTAVSFGRMAAAYPAAGSVYSYISRLLNPHVGFILGWAMVLEYMFQPIQNALYAVLTIHRMVPQIPFAVLAAAIVLLITVLATRSIRFNARTNEVLVGFMLIVTVVFLVGATRHLIPGSSSAPLLSWQPFYNPATFDLQALAAGTSFAALVFIGFDGVSLLAEEVKNPKRNILLATVLVVVFTGVFSGVQMYLAQRLFPDYTQIVNRETAFMDVAQVVGGPILFTVYGVMLLISSLACGLAGHIGASRLLYTMGRDDVLPRKVFGYLSTKSGSPVYNEWIVGALAYIAVLTIPWQIGAEIVTFGALVAFSSVNLMALLHLWILRNAAERKNFFADALLPGFGGVFCFGLILGLQPWTKYAGGAWLLLGVIYAAYRTRMFTTKPKLIGIGG